MMWAREAPTTPGVYWRCVVEDTNTVIPNATIQLVLLRSDKWGLLSCAGVEIAVSHMVSPMRALALEALPRWSPMDDWPSTGSGGRLETGGAWWGERVVEPDTIPKTPEPKL